MNDPEHAPVTPADIAIRMAIVGLALATAYIHLSLGGARFTANAVGYVAWAAAIIAPLAVARRFRWLIRIGMAGYAATTIAAWAVEGPYYETAYLAKAIELGLIVALVIDAARHDGNPVDRLRRELRSPSGREQGPAARHP